MSDHRVDQFSDIKAVLFDFSDVVGRVRMALSHEEGTNPYRIELIDSVADSVERLREAGFKTALVTNNDRAAFKHIAPEIPLDEMFDAVVFSSDVGASKPNFAIYIHALKQLDVDAHQAMFLDDVARNVDAAEALGITGVVVDKPEAAVDAVDALLASRT